MKEPWRIGVLFSSSGVTSVVEQTQLNGTLLALAEINAAEGRARSSDRAGGPLTRLGRLR